MYLSIQYIDTLKMCTRPVCFWFAENIYRITAQHWQKHAALRSHVIVMWPYALKSTASGTGQWSWWMSVNRSCWLHVLIVPWTNEGKYSLILSIGGRDKESSRDCTIFFIILEATGRHRWLVTIRRKTCELRCALYNVPRLTCGWHKFIGIFPLSHCQQLPYCSCQSSFSDECRIHMFQLL